MYILIAKVAINWLPFMVVLFQKCSGDSCLLLVLALAHAITWSLVSFLYLLLPFPIVCNTRTLKLSIGMTPTIIYSALVLTNLSFQEVYALFLPALVINLILALLIIRYARPIGQD